MKRQIYNELDLVNSNESKNIGFISSDANNYANELIECKYFKTKQDLFRFSIAYALQEGCNPKNVKIKKPSKKESGYGISGVDPGSLIYHAIYQLTPDENLDEKIYRLAEIYAEWGITKIYEHYNANGELIFKDLINS